MMKTIIFDNGSFKWEDDYETNRCTIRSTTRLLYRSFDVRGYIYLNDIYEHFGIAWDPHEHNECFIKGSNNFGLSWEHLEDNAFKINIYSVLSIQKRGSGNRSFSFSCRKQALL